jgi:hypothetical protein
VLGEGAVGGGLADAEGLGGEAGDCPQASATIQTLRAMITLRTTDADSPMTFMSER